MKKHNNAVDIARFTGILLIMTHHLYVLGYSGTYIGKDCWVWVEYFFMLTGFFTAKHYAIEGGKELPDKSNVAIEALSYTARKIKPQIPYILIFAGGGVHIPDLVRPLSNRFQGRCRPVVEFPL